MRFSGSSVHYAIQVLRDTMMCRFCSNSAFSLQHPGNIAVDDVNGGRLIFYDFGMMGRLIFESSLPTVC